MGSRLWEEINTQEDKTGKKKKKNTQEDKIEQGIYVIVKSEQLYIIKII